MKKNLLLTFACAMVPGCGQMYQGFMKRGLSLLFWFFAVIGISSMLHIGVLILLLPIIWLYSFFDTFNLRNLSDDQKMALGDFFIPNNGWTQEISQGRWGNNPNSGNTLGVVLIGLGVLGFVSFAWRAVSSFVWNIFPALGHWFGRVPSLLIAGVIIFAGFRLLRGQHSGQQPGGDYRA